MRRLLPVLVLLACARGGPAEQRADTLVVLPEPSVASVPPIAGPARNVILVIGDGMGLAQLHAAATANGGALQLDRFPVVGLARTASADDWITDSAAAATAMATGHKTRNKAIGIDASGAPVPSLIALGEAAGRSTGVVVTCDITHATPAAFVAHVAVRSDAAAIAEAWPAAGVDVVVGGGARHFDDALRARWADDGVTFVDNLDALAAHPTGRVVALTADKHPPPIHERGAAWLPRATREAIRLLEGADTGYLLVIEGAQIDWGGHENDLERVIGETLDLDRVAGALLDHAAARGDTLVVVTADHETGGLVLTGGDPASGVAAGAFHWNEHTAIPVPVFAVGPGAELFDGTYENTAIFHKIRAAWGLGPHADTASAPPDKRP